MGSFNVQKNFVSICIKDSLQGEQKKEILLHEIGHLYFGTDEAYAEKFRSYRLLDLDTFCHDLLKEHSLETCAEHQGMELYDFIAHFENIKQNPMILSNTGSVLSLFLCMIQKTKNI